LTPSRTVCRYQLTITATCPADPTTKDTYDCRITVRSMIPVETLTAKIAELAEQPIYQEALTEAIGHEFKAEVTTRGTHSGVSTTCDFYPDGHPV
jgi:hypothetical protein